jgi:hypothetical protein
MTAMAIKAASLGTITDLSTSKVSGVDVTRQST